MALDEAKAELHSSVTRVRQSVDQAKAIAARCEEAEQRKRRDVSAVHELRAGLKGCDA